MQEEEEEEEDLGDRDPPLHGSQVPDTRQGRQRTCEPKEVTFEDVAVSFSVEEWSALQGWQKALHKEVMLENYSLLFSLGHSIPSVEFSDLISQLEGTVEGQKLVRAVGEEQCRGGRLPFPKDVDGPWDLQVDPKSDRCLTPASDGEGECQSSLHLCALMKLVQEIPEFLCKQNKDPQNPVSASDGESSEAEGTSIAVNGREEAAEPKESQWEPSVTPSPVSGPIEEELCAEPQPQDTCAKDTTSEKEEEEEDIECGKQEKGSVVGFASGDIEPSSAKAGVEEEQCHQGRKPEEKPLRGLLKCLKELIVHHPQPTSQRETLVQRREVGSGGSPPIQVKTEAMEEEHLAHHPQWEGAGLPIHPNGKLFISQKEDSLLSRVKVKQETDSPSLRYPNGFSTHNIPRIVDQRKRSKEIGSLGLKIKQEPNEDGLEQPPFPAQRRPPGEEEEEGPYPHSRVSSSGSAEASMDPGLWVPYSEEWSPATSPLHGLLKCLKGIPVPRPPVSGMFLGKRGAGEGKERRKGGRRARLECSEWATPEKTPHCPTSPAASSCGSGNALQGLKDLPLHATPSQPCSPALCSSIGSSPDRLPRQIPEKAKGPGRCSAPLQEMERCLRELPIGSQSQASSPAVSSSSFGGSPDGLHCWTPDAGRWPRKEEGMSRNSTPLQDLERCLKDLAPSGQPGSPAVSSSIHGSPGGPQRWTPEPCRWSQKEEGPSHKGTPLQGLENFLKELPGTTKSPFLPAMGSTIGSSSNSHPRQGGRQCSPKEEGSSPAGILPLQGLENCLKEIPVRENKIQNPVTVSSNASVPKPRRTELTSQKPFKEDSTSVSVPDISPLHRLMNCLKEIPIQRPNYLKTPSVSSSSSSSSSCSETERDRQSPGMGPWWDGRQDLYQGPGVDESGRQKETHPRKVGKSPRVGLPSEEEVELPPPASPLRSLQNGLKDLTGGPPPHRKVHSSKSAGTQPGLSPAGLRGNGCDPERCSKETAPAVSGPLSSSSTLIQNSLVERDPERRNLGLHAQESATESNPLQGLIQCLKEITRDPSPGSRSVSSSPARKAQREPRHGQVDEGEKEEELGEEGEEFRARKDLAENVKENPRIVTDSLFPKNPSKRMPSPEVGSSHKSANPTVRSTCGPKGNEHPFARSRTSPALKPCVPEWSGSSSTKTGQQSPLVTDSVDNSPASVATSCSFEPRTEPGNPSKKRCPDSSPSQNSLENRGEVHRAELGPVLSETLGRLSADMSAVSRDVSRLQSHLERLEQDARGWVLELASLRMENRSLCEYARQTEARCRTLESRSRRNNLRVLGLPEGAEGGDAVSFLRRTLLPPVLGIPPEIESARRVHATSRPRPLVFRLLRFADKAALLQATRSRPLSFAGTPLTLVPDACPSFSRRHRVPFSAFRRPRWAPDLCFAPRHPSCCCSRPPHGSRQPTACNSLSERDSRVSKGPGNWEPDSLSGPRCLGGCHDAGSGKQHDP
ncbi:protein KRBA1-like isoform X2 [Anolis sagrei]|uniref:protein KRBA1-like isoform X2 n=1 Tax=Anolis sagrei TaxID=38937 RepID=UPI003522C513